MYPLAQPKPSLSFAPLSVSTHSSNWSVHHSVVPPTLVSPAPVRYLVYQPSRSSSGHVGLCGFSPSRRPYDGDALLLQQPTTSRASDERWVSRSRQWMGVSGNDGLR